ncbi:MAG: hypothetical protein LBC76_02125 [Treponema sp.]|nr:hypothetical protein [Treponema sp.]
MKKIVLLCLLAAIICGSVFAQTAPPATTTIKGALGLSAGRIAVVSGDVTYYVRGLERFVGFIDGLKEGAQVSIEGYASTLAFEGQKGRFFYPITLTLNGKNYEVGSPTPFNMMSGRNGRFISPGFGTRKR